jgi:anaerobic magnesium-protoporphyrin IX monomethyl ester cyclase
MKIMFINPPDENTISEAPFEDGESFIEPEDFGKFPPLGLLYVLSYLEQNTTGHELSLVDCVGEGLSHEGLAKRIGAFRPDVVGITSFTISLMDVVEAARAVRRIVPHVHLCLGGHHSIAFPFEAAQIEEFDSIVVGEGEVAFTELVAALEAGGDITRITGVYTSESIKVFEGKPISDPRYLSNVVVTPAYVDDLDMLPTPNRRHISHINYQSTVGVTGRLATMISTRGCPYLCTFCDVPYKKYRKRSTEKVVDEIEECLAQGYTEFHFYDDLFNITPESIITFCEEVEKRRLKIVWDFRGRVNGVSEESLIRAKKAGLRQISFGVETGSDEGLKHLKKGSKTAKYREVFGWCRELGIRTVADFIIGFPFEKTPEDVRENIGYLIELDPDFCVIGVLMLLPGTEIFRQGVEAGQADLQKWVAFSGNPTPDFRIDYWNEFMSTQELMQLRHESYRRFYMRPNYIFRSVLQTRSFYEFKAKFGGFLALLQPARKTKGSRSVVPFREPEVVA